MSHDINDTNPNEPTQLDVRLQAEEPPIRLEDTPPSGSTISLEERLRAEEPPIIAEDTNPSIITRKILADQQSNHKRRGNLQRIVVLVVLLGAVILTGVEVYLWLKSENDTDDSKTVAAEESPVDAESINAPTESENDPTAALDPTTTQPPAESAAQDSEQTANQDIEQVSQTQNNQAESPIEKPAAQLTPQPTAAADEIAAALLAPADVDPPTNVIVRNSAPFTIRSATRRTEIIQYTVQSGDTLDSIAAKFDLNDIYTIIWSNPRNKYTTLRPGTQLTILPEDGVYHEVTEPITIAALAEKYGVTPYDIIDADYNNLFGSLPETLLPPGMWIAVPGGESERVNFFAPVVQNASSGSSGSSGGAGGAGVISGQYTLWGCTSTISGGSPPASRPLQNYKFMQAFSLGFHEAVDLSGNIGDPVFASGSGTVAFAGWNDTGYGNVVVIAHGSHFSIYAHLDSYSVSCGQSVSAGSVIGRLGSTGNSSGPHLHFEIRDANWNPVSPMYIGF
jgi:murein DD-endopeptidase MepM/ murein hydrolase activator NlpD/cytoskeletal protein RodZ